jgi:hypothetical protein
MVAMVATLTSPLRPQGSRAEHDLISDLEGMRQESRIAQEQTDLHDADAHLDAVRGTPPPRGYPAFSLHLLADQVQRTVGLSTDARPILERIAGNAHGVGVSTRHRGGATPPLRTGDVQPRSHPGGQYASLHTPNNDRGSTALGTMHWPRHVLPLFLWPTPWRRYAVSVTPQAS